MEFIPAAHRHDGVGSDLCRRHSAENPGTATRYRTEAERPAAEQYGTSRRARSDLGQTSGSRSAQACLANDPMAGGFGQVVIIAFCPRPRSRRTQPARAGTTGGGALLIEWPEGEASRPNIGYRRCQRISASVNSSTLPSCAGVSSGIIRSSSRRLGLATTKGAAGAASIITPRCASQLTIPDLRAGDDYPSRPHTPALFQTAALPDDTDPGDPPCGLNVTFRTRYDHAHPMINRSSKPCQESMCGPGPEAQAKWTQ